MLGAQFVIEHPQQFPGLVIRDSNPANQLVDANGKTIANSGPITQINRSFVNQGSTEVEGIDLEVAMRNSLGEMGKLNTKLEWDYMLSFKRTERPGEATANVVGSNGGLSDWATSVGDMPRHRASLSTNWTLGVHSLTGTVNFTSAVSPLRRSDNTVSYDTPYCQYGVGQPASAYSLGGLPKVSNYNNSCEVKSMTTVGVAYAYTGFKDLTLSANVSNLFDVVAPYDPRYPTEGYNTQLADGTGCVFRLGASDKFK